MNAARILYRSVATVAFLVLFSGGLQAEPVKLPDGQVIDKVDFERHVIGMLGRAGCNAGSCHGSFQGKGGLYLSLFGYKPEVDFKSFTRDGLGRRLNRVHPKQSLILLKASGQVPHGGAVRIPRNSWEFQLLEKWIIDGAKWEPGSGTVVGMTVEPRDYQFKKLEDSVQLKVMVEFAGGDKLDMTRFCDFRINDDYVGAVTSEGKVTAVRPGDTAVVVSYRGNVRAMRVLAPVPAGGKPYPKLSERGYIDKEAFAKLRKLNIVPSESASDAAFLRRLYIDAIGTVPTPDEVRKFLADKNPAKRDKKIDELLQHPMHAALWATKFCDITGNNVDSLDGQRNLNAKRSKMWHDWFRARFERNEPYDRIVKGVLTATTDEGLPTDKWLDREIKYVEDMTKSFDTDYAKRETLDLFWRRKNFGLEQKAELTAAAFLGVRIECAQCHKHPFDRWTQTDYRGYANIFASLQVGSRNELKKEINKANSNRALKKAKEKIRQVYIDEKRSRPLRHPETNDALPPKALGGVQIDPKGDPRVALFEWMKQPDNPYFAHIMVNRIWGHYFGVGIVDPVDDFAIANPPSNPALLDALAQDFIKHNYDIRHIERVILQSRVYQLSAVPNETNQHDRNNFARAYPRRMMAEVVVDVLNEALGTQEDFGKDVPTGVRAIEVAPNRVQSNTMNYVFTIFGRPPRTTSCDCERAMDPALPQTLFFMTDQNVLNKITNGRLKKLLAEKKPDEEIVEEFFLATLSRLPRPAERKAALEHIEKKKDRAKAHADLIWALINTREFVLNH